MAAMPRTIDGVEAPVERVERFVVAEAGRLQAPIDKPITPPLKFVVYEQSEIVERPKTFGASLLGTYGNRIGHAA
jgi:hypothetical protein